MTTTKESVEAVAAELAALRQKAALADKLAAALKAVGHSWDIVQIKKIARDALAEAAREAT